MALRSERPLYLHFLDRELGNAVGFRLDHETMEQALKVLLLGTSVPLYCGISLIWENTGLGDNSRRILASATAAGVVDPVSYAGTIEEFFESRQRLYRHDASRYPYYFTKGIDGLRLIEPSLYKSEDTTEQLVQHLATWAAEPQKILDEVQRNARAGTRKALLERESQALTFSYFEPYLAGYSDIATVGGVIRREISRSYSTHYLRFANGDIATGVGKLGLFDNYLSQDFPLYDVHLLKDLLSGIGFREILSRPWDDHRAAWETMLKIRGSGLHNKMTRLIRLVLSSLYQAETPGETEKTHFAHRTRMRSLARGYFDDELASGTVGRPDQLDVHIDRATNSLDELLDRMSRTPSLGSQIAANRRQLMDQEADILLVTATQVETEAVISAFGMTPGVDRLNRRFIGDNTFYKLGTVSGARVYLVQSEAGSGGPSGSSLTISEGLNILTPSAVIMVGIAFGVDPARQRLGDILIASQLLGYELQRRGNGVTDPEITLRGDRVSASPRLLDRCRSAHLEWLQCHVRFGLVLSGEKLVDDKDFRDELVRLVGGEAIGGEMEGAGLYAAAHRRKVDWILVKSVSDWADGKKRDRQSSRQRDAAEHAARFVHHLITIGGIGSESMITRV